jgi:hypothetical protein
MDPSCYRQLFGLGGLSSLVMTGLKPAGAAGEGPHPGIFRIPLDTVLTKHLVYPPGVAVGNSGGAYTMGNDIQVRHFSRQQNRLLGQRGGRAEGGQLSARRIRLCTGG